MTRRARARRSPSSSPDRGEDGLIASTDAGAAPSCDADRTTSGQRALRSPAADADAILTSGDADQSSTSGQRALRSPAADDDADAALESREADQLPPVNTTAEVASIFLDKRKDLAAEEARVLSELYIDPRVPLVL